MGYTRGQVSSEFLVIFSALLMIFVVIFTIYFGGDLNLFRIQDRIAAERDAQGIAAAINYVYLGGDGARYNFTLIGIGSDENITLTDHTVTTERPEASGSAPILNAKRNASEIRGGNVILTNNRGELDISNG